jgi:hypothetical protein
MESLTLLENDQTILRATPPDDCLIGLAVTIWAPGDDPLLYQVGADWEDASGTDNSINWFKRRLPLDTRLQICRVNSDQTFWPTPEPVSPLPLPPRDFDNLVVQISVGLEAKKSFTFEKGLPVHFIVTFVTPPVTKREHKPESRISLFRRESALGEIVYYLDEPFESLENVQITVRDSSIS